MQAENKLLGAVLIAVVVFAFTPLAFLGPTTQDDNTWLLTFNEIMSSSEPIKSYFEYVDGYAKRQGRIGFYFSFILISAPYLFKSMFVVGIIKLAALFAFVFTLYKVVRHFAGEINAALSVVFFSTLHTLTWYHNGLTSFSIQFFVLLSVFLLSLLAFDRYLKTGRTWSLIGAVLMYVACLTIEMFFVLFPAYILVAVIRSPTEAPFSFIRRRESLLGLGVLIVAGAIYFAAYAIFESINPSTYGGNRIADEFSFWKFASTNFLMSIWAVPGAVPLADFGANSMGSLFSANGIIYNLSAFSLPLILIWLRRLSTVNDVDAADGFWARAHGGTRWTCIALGAYLFFSVTSLPSLTSIYQSFFLEHAQRGYIYTFVAFVVLAIFIPVVLGRVLQAHTIVFWPVVFSLSLVALLCRGYSQGTYEQMTAASSRWHEFERFLADRPELETLGCIKSDSLFQPSYLVTVTDDYWTRFAESRLGARVSGTQFISGQAGSSDCGSSVGRFESIINENGRSAGWFVVTPEVGRFGRRLTVFTDSTTTLSVFGGSAIQDVNNNLFVPNEKSSIKLLSRGLNRSELRFYGGDIAVIAGLGDNSWLLEPSYGFFPREKDGDGSDFWWASGPARFRVSTNSEKLPRGVSLKFALVPVGNSPESKFTLRCDDIVVFERAVGVSSGSPLEVTLGEREIKGCSTFEIVPGWSAVRLSAGDYRTFSFKVAAIRFLVEPEEMLASPIKTLDGFYPLEQRPDGTPFWWARGTANFELRGDQIGWPTGTRMRLLVIPVGRTANQLFNLLCDGGLIQQRTLGDTAEMPFEILLDEQMLKRCSTFSLVPTWEEVRLSELDTRSFSFQVAQAELILGGAK
jgi:hypothetical protein